jgi:hypothetical protein
MRPSVQIMDKALILTTSRRTLKKNKDIENHVHAAAKIQIGKLYNR